MVAAARAAGSREEDPLFDDPYAAPLVRAVGLDFFTRLVDGEVELPDDGDPADAAFIATSIEDWPKALRESGFDVSVPTAWSAEGLLVYLPPEAQDRHFDDIGGRAQELTSQMEGQGFDLDISKFFYHGERKPVLEYLTEHGWQVSSRLRPHVVADYGRVFPEAESLVPLGGSLAVIATRK
jgi:O-methyltransferase involved in polyketide biosynthesis